MTDLILEFESRYVIILNFTEEKYYEKKLFVRVRRPRVWRMQKTRTLRSWIYSIEALQSAWRRLLHKWGFETRLKNTRSRLAKMRTAEIYHKTRAIWDKTRWKFWLKLFLIWSKFRIREFSLQWPKLPEWVTFEHSLFWHEIRRESRFDFAELADQK